MRQALKSPGVLCNGQARPLPHLHPNPAGAHSQPKTNDDELHDELLFGTIRDYYQLMRVGRIDRDNEVWRKEEEEGIEYRLAGIGYRALHCVPAPQT